MSRAANLSSPSSPRLLLRRLSGPLLTVGMLLGIELLALLGFEMPYPAPAFIMIIVYAFFSGGLLSGVVSVAITLLYNLFYFSTPGALFLYTAEGLRQLIANSLSMPIIALLVGALKYRADKQASGELQESEARFRTTFEQAAVGIAHVDLDGRWLRVNQRLCQIVGYTSDELLGQSFRDITHPDDLEAELLQMRRLRAGDVQTYTLEKRFICKNSSSIWTNLTVSLAPGSARTPQYFIAVIEDITERKRAEAALRDSEARYRRLFETNPEAMWVYEVETLQFLAVNEAAVVRYGYTRDEFLSMTLRDIRPPEDIPRLEESSRQLVEGVKFAGVWRHRKKDGTLIWVEIDTHNLEFDGRSGRLALINDVTERRKAELALAAEKERLAVTLRSIGDGVVTTDTEGHIVLLNMAAETISGWTQAEAADRLINQVFQTFDEQTHQPCPDPVATVLRDGRVVELAKRATLVTRSGAERLISATGAPIRDREGQIIGVVLVFRDITERSSLEQQLQQAQKMESIGVLAGGIAHDFNNILTGIIGTAELALLDLRESEPLWQDFYEIKRQGERGAALTKKLLTFSRRQAIAPSPMNLNAVIEDVEVFIRRVVGPQIECCLKLAPELATVSVDAAQIEQILLNLAINARDAMPDGGKLMITTENVTLDDIFCRAHIEAQPGPYVRLAVEDTGIGMDQETLQHIFEPFFTTKGPGKGTGLGLAMAYGIMKQHRGLIDPESEPGRGTCFSLYFPVVASATEQHSSTQQALSA